MLWESFNINQHSFDVRVIGEVPPESSKFHIYSDSDEILFYNRTTQRFVAEDNFGNMSDVDGLFSLIEQHLWTAPLVEVSYDLTYGFPIDLKISPTQVGMDDEIIFKITALASSGNSGCTTSFEPGIIINSVVDANSQASLICDVTVTVNEGDYTEQLTNQGNQFCAASLTGAGERFGRYTLIVEHEGYQTKVIDNVDVMKSVCHVIARGLDIELTPEN